MSTPNHDSDQPRYVTSGHAITIVYDGKGQDFPKGDPRGRPAECEVGDTVRNLFYSLGYTGKIGHKSGKDMLRNASRGDWRCRAPRAGGSGPMKRVTTL